MALSEVKPYANSNDSKKNQVEDMFDQIAPKYDFLNHFLSAGIDIWWRKKALSMLKPFNPQSILDVATGTADFAIQAHKSLKPAKIKGLDLSEQMIAYGRVKLAKLGLDKEIELVKGDSEGLCFGDKEFNAVTVAFGVRNFENLEKGLTEINRVIKDNGQLLILEFSKPRSFPVKQLYQFYSYTILPFFGRLISKDKRAYEYLPESVAAFPEGQNLVNILTQCGFKKAEYKALTFGIVTVYLAQK